MFVLVLRLYRSCDASTVSYTCSCRYPHDCGFFLCPVSVCEPLGPYSSGDVLSSPNLHYIQDTGTEVRRPEVDYKKVVLFANAHGLQTRGLERVSKKRVRLGRDANTPYGV